MTSSSKTFPKSFDWNKIQACTQKSDESVHEYYNWFQIIFKEKSDLPSDVDSTQVAFNSVYQWAELRPFSSSNKDEDGMGNYVHSRFN